MANLSVIAEIRKKRLRLKIDHPYFKGDEFNNNINPNVTDRLTIMALTALFSFDQNLLGAFLQNLDNNDRNTIFGTNHVQDIMNAYYRANEETLENSTAYLHQLPNNIKQALFNNFPNFMNSLNTVLHNTIFSPESVNLVNNNTPQQNDTENFGRTVEDKAKRFSAGGDALVALINTYNDEKVKIAYAASLILRTNELTQTKKDFIKTVFSLPFNQAILNTLKDGKLFIENEGSIQRAIQGALDYESYKKIPFKVKKLINLFQPNLNIQFDRENESTNQTGGSLQGQLKKMITQRYQALNVNKQNDNHNMSQSSWGEESSILVEPKSNKISSQPKPSGQLAKEPGDTSIYQAIARLAPTAMTPSYNQDLSHFLFMLYTGRSIGMNTQKEANQDEEKIIERAILNIPSQNITEALHEIANQGDFINAPYFIKENGQIVEKKISQLVDNPLWQQGNKNLYQAILKIKKHREFLDNLFKSLELVRKINIFVFKENNTTQALENLNSLIQDNNGLYQKMRNAIHDSGNDLYESAFHKVANLLGDDVYLQKVNGLEQEGRRQEAAREELERNRLQQEQAAQNHLRALQAKAEPRIDYENLPLEIKNILTHGRNNEVIIDNERTTLDADKFSQTFQELVLRLLTEMPGIKGNTIIGRHKEPTEAFSSLWPKEKFFLLKIMEKKGLLDRTYWEKLGDGGNWKTEISALLNQAKK